MHGFAVFLGKELKEIVRTWRLFVIPGIMLFLGMMSPIFAEIAPGLVSSIAANEAQGIVIEIPPATTVDAYLQFNKNAMQIALIAVIIATAGAVSAERRAGTAQIVLVKPVSRGAMVIAKILSNWILLLVATAVSATLCASITAIMFDSSLTAEFAKTVVLWYLLAALMVAISVFLSVLFNSQAGAAGAGIAIYFVLSLASIWGVAREYTPAGLLGAGDKILTGVPDVPVAWPVVTSVAMAAAVSALAVWTFRRQEI